MNVGLMMPSIGVGFYVACRIGDARLDDVMGAIGPYIPAARERGRDCSQSGDLHVHAVSVREAVEVLSYCTFVRWESR